MLAQNHPDFCPNQDRKCSKTDRKIFIMKSFYENSRATSLQIGMAYFLHTL